MLSTHFARRAVAAAGLCAGLSSSAAAAEDEHWRVFVADHTEAAVRAVDLETGDVVGRFEIKGPASLHKSATGRTVFAVQGDGNLISAIASGIEVDDHGDHGDIEVSAPRLLDAVAEGGKPSHFVQHDGQIAIFFDGDGKAAIVSEKQFIDGKLDPRIIATDAPHHGVAATFGGHVLMSAPHPEDPAEELPIGIRVLDREGAAIGDTHGCPDLHGEAASGDWMAFACAAGLLFVEPDADGPSIRLLEYPDTLPEGKVTTLRGAHALRYFLGNYGPDAIVLVEPEAEEPFRLVNLPTRRVDFIIDPGRPERVFVFTEDGQLHRVNAVKGKIEQSAKITQPYSMDGHWRDPRPRLAVAGDFVIVTDPHAGLVRIVDGDTLAASRTIDVDGMPYNIVAVGGAGESH